MQNLAPIQEICYEELNRFYSFYVDGAKKICVRKRRPVLTAEGVDTEFSSRDTNFDAYFDKNGRLLKAIVFYTEAEIDLQLSYNTEGKLELMKYLEIPSGRVIREGKVTYDSKGRPIKKVCRSYDQTDECDGIQTYNFSYAPYRIIYDAKLDDYIEDKKEFLLDSQNRIIEIRSIAFPNKFDEWVVYSYGEDGLMEKSDYKDVDGKTTDTYFLTYENGLFVKEVYQSANKKNKDGVATYLYKVNSRGHMLEKTMVMDNELKWVEECSIQYY